MKKALLTSTASVAGAVLVGFVLWKLLQKSKKTFKRVGIVSQLFIHPIKSCRGVSVQTAQCTQFGLVNGHMRDRVFLVIKPDGTFITARQEQRLLLVTPSFEGNTLNVNAPQMPTLRLSLDDFENGTLSTQIVCKVWDQAVGGYDCGDEPAQWFQKYLGKSIYRLVHFREGSLPKICKVRTKYQKLFEDDDKTAYADLTPYMLMAEASVEDLNKKLELPVGMRNFRPNIVIGDSEPYAEDKWKVLRTENGVQFRNVKPCQRCIVTTMDPDTAVRNGEDPLKTLKIYRKNKDPYMKQFVGESALLGVDLCIDDEGVISVGDTVYAY